MQSAFPVPLPGDGSRPAGSLHARHGAAVSPANFCAAAVGGAIDPKPVEARDGTWWLTWKLNANVTRQPTALLSEQLGANGEPTGPVHTLVTSDQPWEVGMVESPSFVQDEVTGTWWLTLSGGDFGKPNSYQIAAMPCASLAGPCYDQYTVHLVTTNSQGVGPGEQDAFTEPDGAMWILYNPSGPFVDPALRPLAVVRLGFTTAGLPYIGNPNQNYTPSIPEPVEAVAATPGGLGYWLADAQGFVTAHGNAVNYGDMAFAGLNAPIVKMTATPDGKGYWLLGADGGVFTFGDAGYYGSTGGLVLGGPVVGMTATPDGKGYWLVGSDGGVFAFGDARFAGSMGGKPLAAPIVGIAPDKATGGYWLVGTDGGVFAFDAPFLGSTGNQVLNAPVNGISATPTGPGYMFVASDGGIFTYGDAAFHGSTGGMVLNAPITGAAVDQPPAATGWSVSTAASSPSTPPSTAPADRPADQRAGGSGPVRTPPPSSHVDGHVEGVGGAPAEHDALERRHVGVVAAPGRGHVRRSDDLVVGRVEVEPAPAGHEHGQPGVRGVGARPGAPGPGGGAVSR